MMLWRRCSRCVAFVCVFTMQGEQLVAPHMLASPDLILSRSPHTAHTLQGTGPHSVVGFAELQQRTQRLQSTAAAATGRLEEQRRKVSEASAAAKDALRKCDALPAFQPGASPDGDAAALLQRQPLEPALGALRDDIRRQLQQLRLTADDLQECLMVRVGVLLACWAHACSAPPSPRLIPSHSPSPALSPPVPGPGGAAAAAAVGRRRPAAAPHLGAPVRHCQRSDGDRAGAGAG